MLLVAWYFPPDGGAGSQRPCSFANHLPDLGWDVSVLTRSAERDRSRLETMDQGLLGGIDPRVSIDRILETGPIPEVLGRYEQNIAAIAGPFCTGLAGKVAGEQPAITLITMSPFILSRLVPTLKSTSRTRVVLDLRDPWALDYWPTTSRRNVRVQRRQMLETLRRVDGVVLNTVQARSEVLSSFGPSLPPDFDDRICVVENGFSSQDFADPVSAVTDQLVVSHFGTFLCDQLPYRQRPMTRIRNRFLGHSRGGIDRSGRTPHYLLEAAGTLARTTPEVFDSIRFRFIGHIDSHLRSCVDRCPCPEKVELIGYLDHSEMIRELQSSTALFLPCGKLDASIRELIVPGKTYEYLASCRPIIAALHPGDALDLVLEAGGNYTCAPCSSESIAAALRGLHADWKAGSINGSVARSAEFLGRYERGHLASRLSGFLEKILRLPVVGPDDA